MKNILSNTVLVAALTFTSPVFAQETTSIPVSPVVRATPDATALPQPADIGTAAENQAIQDMQKSALWQAYMAVLMDLKPIFSQDDIQSKLEHLDGFEFSAETRKKLFDLFGNDNPLHLRLSKLANGNAELSFKLDALDHQDAVTGSKSHTSILDGKALYHKHYTQAHIAAAMPLFTFDDGRTLQLKAGEFSLTADQALGVWGMWFGNAIFKLDYLAIDDSKSTVHVKLNGMSVKADAKRHGKLVDIDEAFDTKSINWGSDEVGPVHMAFTLANIDGKELAAIDEKAKRQELTSQTDEQKVAAATAMLKDLAVATLTHGGAIEIKDMSVQYHGRTAGLNGRITFDHVLIGDFDTPKLVTDKMVTKLGLHLPMTMAVDLSRMFARQMTKAKHKCCTPITDDEVNATAKKELDEVLKNLTQKKWITIRKGIIYSTIDYRAGRLLVNGQSFQMPTRILGRR